MSTVNCKLSHCRSRQPFQPLKSCNTRKMKNVLLSTVHLLSMKYLLLLLLLSIILRLARSIVDSSISINTTLSINNYYLLSIII